MGDDPSNTQLTGAAAFLATIIIFIVTYGMGVCIGRRYEPGSKGFLGLSILAFFIFVIVVIVVAALLL